MQLRLDGHEVSPGVLLKAVTAGGEFRSYERASQMLEVLADVRMSGMQVARLTEEIGGELAAVRDEQAERHRRRELPSEAVTPVPIACVEVDGGRLQTRASEAPRGVHEPAWKESKVACLWRMEGAIFSEDPHPEPPRCFRDPEHVQRLVREIKNVSSPHADRPEPDPQAAGSRKRSRSAEAGLERPWPPKRVYRTAVATLRDVHEFGPLVAAEAQCRGFYDAARQVFLGDGDHKNWTIHKTHFPHFTAVTDFVHVTAYLYQAAGAVTNSFAAQWEQYETWLVDCWQGRVADVLERLHEWRHRLGEPSSGPLAGEPDVETIETEGDSDPRVITAKVMTYLRNNAARMNYPAYRRQGLPITSCLVESLIKQFNQRVKGSEKFWCRPDNAEAILQVRAALLSDDDRLAEHIRTRPGRATRRRPQPQSRTG